MAEPIRSTTQNWVLTRHQYGISALVCQSSFRGETSERWPAIVAGSVYSTFEVYSITPKLCDVFESLESPFIWMSYNSPNKLAIKVTLITPVR